MGGHTEWGKKQYCYLKKKKNNRGSSAEGGWREARHKGGGIVRGSAVGQHS